MDGSIELRARIRVMLEVSLGSPEVTALPCGEVYRWSLRRMYGLTLYVTLDAPEHADVAHVTLSDGPRFQARPVESHLVRTEEDGRALVERIVRQWKSVGGQDGA